MSGRETIREARTGSRRVNVSFSEHVYEMLEELAEKKGKSMTDILRDAVALEAWLQKEWESGSRIIVEREGSQRELVRF
jgi:metal-responsive CopG/Arc/MetJ family transcriptional regulator